MGIDENEPKGEITHRIVDRGSLLLAAAIVGIAFGGPPAHAAEAVPQDPTSQPAPDGGAAESSKESNVTLGLAVRRVAAENSIITLHGSRTAVGNSGPFQVNAVISRIPCVGEYSFEAAQENTHNGNTETYKALIQLSDDQANSAGARCGVSLPSSPGYLNVWLGTAGHELFDLVAHRRRADPFRGSLLFKSFPHCGPDYTLSMSLTLNDTQRNLDFSVRMLEVKATVQGRKIPSEKC